MEKKKKHKPYVPGCDFVSTSHVAQWFHLLCVYVFSCTYAVNAGLYVFLYACVCMCPSCFVKWCHIRSHIKSCSRTRLEEPRERELVSFSSGWDLNLSQPFFFSVIPLFSVLIIFISISFFRLCLFAYSLGIVSKAHPLFPISCLCRALLSAPIPEHGSHWQHTHTHKGKKHFWNIYKNAFSLFLPFLSLCVSTLAQIYIDTHTDMQSCAHTDSKIA